MTRDRSASALCVAGAGHGLVGLRLRQIGSTLHQGSLGRCHLRPGLSACRLRGLERVARFVFEFAIQRAAGHQLADPRVLGLPARDVRLGADLAGLHQADVGLGSRHRGLGGLDRRRGQLDLRLRLNQRRLLLAELVFQLGEEQVHEELIGLHAVADVHVELLDVGRQLGQQRCLLEGLDLARLHALQAERLPHRPGGGDAHRGSSRSRRRCCLLRRRRRGRMTAGQRSQRGGSQRTPHAPREAEPSIPHAPREAEASEPHAEREEYKDESHATRLLEWRKVGGRRSRGRRDRATPTRSSRATAPRRTPKEARTGWRPWQPPDRR